MLGSRLQYYYLILILVLLTVFSMHRLMACRFGRALTAIRENELAAEATGVDTTRYKIQAFVLAAGYAGIAGSFYAHFVKYISPDSFTINESFILLAMLAFGGQGNLLGPVVGAAPVIVKLSITVYVDLGLIFFSTAALLQLLRWAETGFPLKRLVLSGIFAGLCLGTKPNGMLSFFFLAAAVPFLCRADTLAPSAQPSDDPRSHLQKKSNLGALGWDAGGSQAPDNREKGVSGSGHFAGRKVIFGESLLEILAIPLRVFFQGQDDNPRLFDGRLNPYLLVFPLIAVWRANGRRRPPRIRLEIRLLGAFSLLYLLFAFFLVDMRIRYIAPIIPPLVILAVIGIQDLIGIITSKLSMRPRRLALGAAGVFFLGLLGLNAAYLVDQFRVVDPVSYLRGEVSREAYILKYRPEYAAISFANRNLPENARILALFNGNRIYYSERELVCDNESFRRAVNASKSSADLVQTLRGNRISHLLVRADLFSQWVESQFQPNQKAVLRSFFGDALLRLYQGHGYVLFAVTAG